MNYSRLLLVSLFSILVLVTYTNVSGFVVGDNSTEIENITDRFVLNITPFNTTKLYKENSVDFLVDSNFYPLIVSCSSSPCNIDKGPHTILLYYTADQMTNKGGCGGGSQCDTFVNDLSTTCRDIIYAAESGNYLFFEAKRGLWSGDLFVFFDDQDLIDSNCRIPEDRYKDDRIGGVLKEGEGSDQWKAYSLQLSKSNLESLPPGTRFSNPDVRCYPNSNCLCLWSACECMYGSSNCGPYGNGYSYYSDFADNGIGTWGVRNVKLVMLRQSGRYLTDLVILPSLGCISSANLVFDVSGSNPDQMGNTQGNLFVTVRDKNNMRIGDILNEKITGSITKRVSVALSYLRSDGNKFDFSSGVSSQYVFSNIKIEYSGYCSSTDISCGCTSCTNCNSQDGWYNKGSAYACCDGNNRCTCQDQEYRDYKCSGTSCAYTVTSTQTVKTGCTSCGSCGYCSSGNCMNYCSGIDTSCGCTSCINCNAQDSLVGSKYCLDNDVYQKYRDYYCSGTSCTYNERDQKITECDDGITCTADSCNNAVCVNTRYCSGSDTSCGCTSCSNCNSQDGWYNKGSSYACCDSNNKCTCQDQEYRDYKCSGAGCIYSVTGTQTVKSGCAVCDDGITCTSNSCSDGNCVYTPYCQATDISCGCTTCSNCNSQDGLYGNTFCESGDLYQKYRDYYCSEFGCIYGESDRLIKDCNINEDINLDCEVNIFDLAAVGIAFGSRPGDTNWNAAADLNSDGKINIFDLAAVGLNFGKEC